MIAIYCEYINIITTILIILAIYYNHKYDNNHKYDMGVSKNNGTPKSSILIGFSIINHPFWGTPIFGNNHIDSSRSIPISAKTKKISAGPYLLNRYFHQPFRLGAGEKNGRGIYQVYQPPRMPVTNEGLGWDSLLNME